ncbi:FMN-binding protein [Saccharicrinis sp. FJH62]|uniref:FMN-binding protein n=1 Tax=Saccharicrinis sp. FJH62 TaxID=3344657 RepID=UPI0035D410AE
MGIRIIIIGIVFAASVFGVPAQNTVDFKHKSLQKALQKYEVPSVEHLREITLSDSLIKTHAVNGKFFRIVDDPEATILFVYVGRVLSCRAGGCSINGNKNHDGDSEYFDYFMFFDPDKTVRLVKVFNYQATHGQEVTARGWLRQFAGFDGTDNLDVGKNIDAISGATISVNALTFDVQEKTGILQRMKW